MSYSSIGILLALLSAIMTSSAHALLKAGKDKLAVRALIGAVGTIALAPICFFVPLPTSEMISWLATASLLHAVYQLVLIRAYEASDFAVAIVRRAQVASLVRAEGRQASWRAL